MILHIPHSSTVIPKDSNLNCTQNDINLLTDWYTDELFSHKDSERVVFEYSRLFCDVERYRDDKKEEMFKKGHGVVYLNGATGNRIRQNLNESEYIKNKFYDVHHYILNAQINKQLSLFPETVIVDCHSFNGTTLTHENSSNRPDFCIGYNSENVFPYIDDIIKLLNDNNYTVGINDPFNGSIIPEKYVGDGRVKTIMIEINRNLYLDDKYKRSENFNKIKEIISQILDIVSKYEKDCDI